MIAQHLNRDFVQSFLEASEYAIKNQADNEQITLGAPSDLYKYASEELEALFKQKYGDEASPLAMLAQWLTEAVKAAAEEKPLPEPEQISEQPPPPRNDRAYMPRPALLGLFQTALDEFAEDNLAETVVQSDLSDDRRSGPLPVVTDSSISDVNMTVTDEDRRVFGKMEVAHPEILSDPRWASVAFSVIGRAFVGTAEFLDHPPEIDLGNPAKVLLVGDWGSGLPRALEVAKRMSDEIDRTPKGVALHVIHLGDVYYSGTKREYRNRFLGPWPVRKGQEGINSYALNGNHEMFSGGHGYFESCLRDDERFQSQQGCSYFRLANDKWQLLAMDTAYDDEDLHGKQLDWLHSRHLSFPGKSIFLSHHQLFSPYEACAPGLRKKVSPLLVEKPVDAWFWAHEHRCLAYRDHENVKFAGCVGHGGIPEYLAKELPHRPEWVAYEFRKLYSTGWEPWNTFGFTVIDVEDDRAIVRYISEQGENHYETEIGHVS